MEVSISEITRRLIIRYYPVWLMICLLRYYRMKLIYQLPNESFVMMFVPSQVSFVLVYLAIAFSLWILNPVKIVPRLIIMAVTMFLIVAINLMVKGIHFGVPLVPFFGPSIVTQAFISEIVGGVFVLWFFFIAERSLAAEKKLLQEKSGRLSHEKQLVENRLKLLQTQIEPQFLFNSLTKIVHLRETAFEKARAMQSCFINYVRATLVKTRVRVTTIQQEMELMAAYLDMFKTSMGERLTYSMDIDPETKSLAFPSMLVQPLVENAIKHGLESKPEGGHILIHTKREQGFLHVQISDSGCGYSDKKKLGAGLSNIVERIETLFDGRGGVVLEDNQPTGLKVIIKVPHE